MSVSRAMFVDRNGREVGEVSPFWREAEDSYHRSQPHAPASTVRPWSPPPVRREIDAEGFGLLASRARMRVHRMAY